MAERLNAAVSKTVKDASPSGVRIPPSPPMPDSQTLSVDSRNAPNAYIFWRTAVFHVYFNSWMSLRSVAQWYSESVDILCFACTSAGRSTQHLGLILGAIFFGVLPEIGIPRSLETPAYFGAVNRSRAQTFVVLRRRKRIAAILANFKIAGMATFSAIPLCSGQKTAKMALKGPFSGVFAWTSAPSSAMSSNPLKTQETRHE